MDDRIVRSGSTSGLQLLLNLNQNEYCETARKYEGAGFQLIVHDPENIAPSFTISSSINLHPGYIQTITLRPTVFIKNTLLVSATARNLCTLLLTKMLTLKTYVLKGVSLNES